MTSNALPFTELSGQTIKSYELKELIGKGGFGAVYRAYQPTIKREVAVKVILPEYVNHPEFIRRFEAEAQLIAHLEHIHIVPLYDYWRDPSGAFLVMRWLRGGSLRAALEKGHWPLNDAIRLVDHIGSALSVAHRHGVIHRDLKPDNILLDEEKNAYLADFGIARDLQNLTQIESLYAAEEKQGIMMGSPQYLSPEQIRTDPISPQTDIYSFGILIYEILTGKTPFHGLPISTLITKHLQEPLPSLNEIRPDLPDELNIIIKKATEKNPENRYANVQELTAAFRKALLASDAGLLQQRTIEPDVAELTRLGIITEVPTLGGEAVDLSNPYKGLRAFQEADAGDFFGREKFINRLIERLKKNDQSARFISVIGPSGSGKSSVVKAGLIPRLRRDTIPNSSDWFYVEMTPGDEPLEALETALLRVAVNPPENLREQLRTDENGLTRVVNRILPGHTSPLVLVIDQFEEAFTQAENEDERAHFLKIILNALGDASSRLRVITTLRADFYDRPLLYPEFGELMRESTEVILPLNRDELEKAIIEPAEKAGLGLEVGLVTAIVADVEKEPGSLPLLQYALTELFERRDGRWLTLQAYKDIGGVSGALARRADELYAMLDKNGKRAAQQMFLRLVTITEGAEDTRRRAQQSELLALQGDEKTMQDIIDLFGKFRLLTFDRDQTTRSPTIEVAHEALIRQWQLLRGWLQDNRENLLIQRRLTTAAEEWFNSGKDDSYLASGTRLDQFEIWSKETELALTGDEFTYLDASLAERVQRRAAEEARKAKEAALERRSRNFLRALAVVLAIATIGALGLSAFAFNQSQVADQNASTATVAQGEALIQADNAATAAAVAIANENEAHSLAFSSGAQLALDNNNTDLAILLALQANEIGTPNVQTQRTLAEAAYAPGTRRVFSGHTDRVTSVAYSPDGKTAISGARDNSAILWDIATGQILYRLEGHTDWVWSVAFSPDGKTALTASQDKTLILWDLGTGKAIRTFEGHTDAVRSVAFSSNGTQALSGSADSTLILWDVATGEAIRIFQNNSPIYTVAFSKSGFTAISGGKDGVVTLWNVQSGDALIRFGADGTGHTSEVWSIAYTADEQGIISASDDSTLILWSFESPQPVRRFVGHSSRVTSVTLSPDGKTMASGSEDNFIITWDIATGTILHRFIGHTSLVYAVAYSPDGLHLLSGAWDNTLRLWDLENGAQVQNYQAHTAPVLGVAYSPDGKSAISASADNSLIVWNLQTGSQLHHLEGHTAEVNAVAFSPDGKSAISASTDTSLILWNLETGEMIRRFGGAGSNEGHSDAVWAVAFSPDGKNVVSGSRDNTLIIWDVATGKQLNRLFGHTFHITGVDYSPDGTQIISCGFDNVLILWDAATGKEIRRFEGHTDWIQSVTFSPDGKQVLSGSADNSLILWDVASGKRIRQYEGHTAQVFSVAFSPDGKYAVSGSADSTIIVWDVESGAELRHFTGHIDEVKSVAFSPDGLSILSGSGDTTMRLWRVSLSLEELIAWVKSNRYVRELTCAERELYDAEPLCPTPTPVFGPGSV